MKTTRHLGNCQVCEGDQKLHEGRMVHHGYRRPGDGVIHGDCPGVGEVPYEVSCGLVKSYKTEVEHRLAGLERRLTKIRDGRVTYFTRSSLRGRGIETTQYAIAVSASYVFDRALESLRWELEGHARGCQRAIGRCEQRIAAWAPQPIRTVEEEQRKADAGRAERKAERDAARAAREAKKAATRAKQDALKAKRLAIQEDFEAKFRALAASPESPERHVAARTLLGELDKAKYRSWLGKRDLRCERELATLGLGSWRIA